MNPIREPASTHQAIDWLADGSPYSTRFSDRYHSRRDGGISQSIGSFLHGCHLPEAWANQSSWCILETGFGLGLNFLVTWQAWRDDPQRAKQLHFVATEAWPVSADELLAAASQRYPQLLPLAQELLQQYWDMHSGIHRISLDNNRVHLTLAIGDTKQWLRSEAWQADSIYLDGFSPDKNPDMWSLDTLKAVARCCTPGHTRLATWCVTRHVRDDLSECGFDVVRVAGIPPKTHNLQAVYAPKWPLKQRAQNAVLTAPLPAALRDAPERRCVVIGAGIAGASTARAMAERGWQVCVIDQANSIAQGASALPAGLFAPHITPDDAPLSRLTRQGLRATRKTAQRLLREAQDWQASGVMEHRIDKKSGLTSKPPAQGIASHASLAATPAQRLQAGIDAAPTHHNSERASAQHPAVWHAYAGWIKSAQLVAALLDHPRIETRLGREVVRLAAVAPSAPVATTSQDPDRHVAPHTAPWTAWRLQLASTDRPPAHASDHNTNQPDQDTLNADCVIVAAAHHSRALLTDWSHGELPLNAVRGQVAWGLVPDPVSDANTPPSNAWPAWPINGKGSLIRAPLTTAAGASAGSFWISGGTFERDNPLARPTAAEVEAALQANQQRLEQLMPATGPTLAGQLFGHAAPALHTWTGVRCTVPDRAPLYGALDHSYPNLLLAAGLGSRGLSLSLMCAEALACALHEEPLPIEQSLAKFVSASRWQQKQ